MRSENSGLPAGRPRGVKHNRMTPELAEAFFHRMVVSDRGLEHVCRELDMPSVQTVWNWIRKDEDFRAGFRAARELQGVIQADRALVAALEAPDPATGRLQFMARKWVASRLAPHLFGDRIAVEHRRGHGAPVEAHDLQAAARLASLFELARLRKEAAALLNTEGEAGTGLFGQAPGPGQHAPDGDIER